MRHQKIQQKLSDFVDGRLSSTEEQYVRDHLGTCPACRALLTSFQVLHRTSQTTHFEVNPFFATRVLAELESRQREGFWTIFDLIPRPLIVTGLAVSIITLAIFAAPITRMNDSYATEYAMFYGDNSEMTTVTDDQALAIAINAQAVTNGE